MTNRRIVAGLLTGIAAGVVISLVLSSEKGRGRSKKIFREGNILKDELKGKFNEFIDRVQGKVHGILK